MMGITKQEEKVLNEIYREKSLSLKEQQERKEELKRIIKESHQKIKREKPSFIEEFRKLKEKTTRKK